MDTLKPPAYLLKNLQQNQQMLQIAQANTQGALTLIAEWAAETLGISLEEIIAGYQFDGKVFKTISPPIPPEQSEPQTPQE